MEITFNELPAAVSRLHDKLEIIESLLKEKAPAPARQSDQWFDLSELCAYLPDKPAKPTVYAWINQSLIPHRKTSKKLRFLKSEIDLWLNQGRRRTISEIQSDSDQFLSNLKKRK